MWPPDDERCYHLGLLYCSWFQNLEMECATVYESFPMFRHVIVKTDVTFVPSITVFVHKLIVFKLGGPIR